MADSTYKKNKNKKNKLKQKQKKKEKKNQNMTRTTKITTRRRDKWREKTYRHVSRGGGRKRKAVKAPFFSHLGKDAILCGRNFGVRAAKESHHGDARLTGIVG